MIASRGFFGNRSYGGMPPLFARPPCARRPPFGGAFSKGNGRDGEGGNGAARTVKSKIVNNCARGLYTHFMFIIYAFGSRAERSEERLPKAARGSIKSRNAAVEQLLGPQIDLRDLVVAVAKRGKLSTLGAQLQFCSNH